MPKPSELHLYQIIQLQMMNKVFDTEEEWEGEREGGKESREKVQMKSTIN